VSLAIFGNAQGEDLPFVSGLTVWQLNEEGAPPTVFALEVCFSNGRLPIRLGSPGFSSPNFGSFSNRRLEGGTCHEMRPSVDQKSLLVGIQGEKNKLFL
jgi:hypothetical protein